MGFGSSSQQSQNSSVQNSDSYNQAYPFLFNRLSPQTAWAGKGNSAIASLLGLQGDTGQAKAFENYKDSSGYNFIKNQGIDSINANDASKGLLASGSALKAITDYSGNLASTFLDNYLNRLSGLSASGNTAAGILASAGGKSKSSGRSSGTSSGSSSQFSLG